jgi:lactoylglutathione lyase
LQAAAPWFCRLDALGLLDNVYWQLQMQSHFNHIALSVADLKRSTAFYREVIQAEIISDPFGDDRHVWFKIGEHNQLHLIAGDVGEEPGRGMHFAFSVSSLDDFLRHLDFKGVEYDDGKGKAGEIRLRIDGVKQIYLQDPDGYWIEINEDRY